MHPVDNTSDGSGICPVGAADNQAVYLRLYIAGSTPNSVRAERNLTVALASMQNHQVQPLLEIIDVFLQPRSAVTEGVIVTPTLIGLSGGKRVVLMGDLADREQLESVLVGLSRQQPERS